MQPTMAVLTADCLPVVLMAEMRAVLALPTRAARSGGRVLESLLAAMPAEPASITAWLGPAISAGAYEVGPEVKTAFEQGCGEGSGDCCRLIAKGTGWRFVGTGTPQAYPGCPRSQAGRYCRRARSFSPIVARTRYGRMATLVWLTTHREPHL